MAKTTHLSNAKHPFIYSIQEVRKRASENLLKGPVTETYHADQKQVIKLLNEALATEIICVLRYKTHYYLADGILSQPIAEMFNEHAQHEQEHMNEISARIKQLGGIPNLNPDGIMSRSLAEFNEGETLVQMIEVDLVAERIVIDSYREMIEYIGVSDPTTRRLVEHILAEEEEHADELASLLTTLDPTQPGEKTA